MLRNIITKYLIPLMIAISIISQTNQMIEVVWEADLAQSNIMIGNISGVCYNGNLIIYDNQRKQLVKIQKEDGQFEKLYSFDEGRGPNEILAVNSIDCDSKKIYLIDYHQFKVLEFDINTHSIQENKLDFPLNFFSKVHVLNNDLYVLNYNPDETYFYRRLSDQKQIIKPIKEEEIPRHAQMAMEQLTQAELMYHDGYYFNFLVAPYRAIKLNNNYEKVEIKEDEKSIEPWDDHIFANEESYRVDRYPMANCFQADIIAVCEYNIYEKEESYLDIWDLSSFKKIVSYRHEKEVFEMFLAQAIPNLSDKEIYLFFINHETLNTKMVSFKF